MGFGVEFPALSASAGDFVPVRTVNRQEALFTFTYTKRVAVPIGRNLVPCSCSVKTTKAFLLLGWT